MKRILTKIIALTLVALGAITLMPAESYAVTDVCNTAGLSEEVRDAAGCNNNTKNALPDIIKGILLTVIAAAGLVAVIFVIIGGVNYMTSTGDPGKAKKAKDTILYALIGLVISVLSFAIVNFVIGGMSTKSASSEEQSDEQNLRNSGGRSGNKNPSPDNKK